jgi:hypothetical protein
MGMDFYLAQPREPVRVLLFVAFVNASMFGRAPWSAQRLGRADSVPTGTIPRGERRSLPRVTGWGSRQRPLPACVDNYLLPRRFMALSSVGRCDAGRPANRCTGRPSSIESAARLGARSAARRGVVGWPAGAGGLPGFVWQPDDFARFTCGVLRFASALGSVCVAAWACRMSCCRRTPRHPFTNISTLAHAVVAPLAPSGVFWQFMTRCEGTLAASPPVIHANCLCGVVCEGRLAG